MASQNLWLPTEVKLKQSSKFLISQKYSVLFVFTTVKKVPGVRGKKPVKNARQISNVLVCLETCRVPFVMEDPEFRAAISAAAALQGQ